MEAPNNTVKVAHILKDLVVGGIQTLLLDLMAYYQHHNQDFIFIAIGDGEARQAFEELGKEFYFVPKRFPFFDPLLVAEIRKIIVSENINIVHAHHSSEGIAAYLASRKAKISCVLSYHVAPQISNFQDNWVFKKLSSRVTGVVPSQAQLREIQEAGYHTGRVHIIHNGVSPERIGKAGSDALRKAIGAEEDHILLGMVGNFYNDTRDQLTICRALPAVFQKSPRARFVFFGGHSSRYMSDLAVQYKHCLSFCREAGIADKVFFPGLVKDAGAIHAALDLFVYSSRHDTFGIAVVEAMFNEVPVLLNDIPVFKELTEEGKYAQLFRTGDAEDLGLKIITALRNLPETQRLAKKAREFVTSRYHIRVHAKKLHQLYQNIISRHEGDARN